MWIIHCTKFATAHTEAAHFLVGPFGTDDQADDTAGKLEAAGDVLAVVAPLVEPARAMAGATL